MNMLDEAIELARSNPITDLPKMAAIIYDRKKIISTGFNSRKSHPLAFKFSESHLKICTHAEVQAIINALKTHKPEELSGLRIVVARILKNGSTAKAKPCISCQRALANYGIEVVNWTGYEDSNKE